MKDTVKECKSKVSAKVWERIRLVAEAASKLEITTLHNLRQGKEFIRDDYERLSMMISSGGMEILVCGSAKQRIEKSSGTLVLTLNSGIDYGDALEAIADRALNEKDDYASKRVPNFLTGLGEFRSEVFWNRHSMWDLALGETESLKVIDYTSKGSVEKPIPPEAIHVAKLLTGMALEEGKDHERERVWERSEAHVEAMRQLYEFLHTGTINVSKPKKLDVKSGKGFPKGLLTVNDGGNALVRRHGQYCPGCGKLMSGCFCSPVREKANVIADSECFPCIQKRINDWLQGKNTTAIGLDDALNNTLLCDEQVTDKVRSAMSHKLAPSKKFWTDRKLKELWDAYHEALSDEDFDYEGPENSCSCPAWGEGE